MSLNLSPLPDAASASSKSYSTASLLRLGASPRFADTRQQELELLLADAQADAERRLFNELRDRVHLDDVDVVDGAE